MEFDHEALAVTAQSYMQDKPAIILGCGASVPYGLPTMKDLADGLLRRIDLNNKSWMDLKIDLETTGDLESCLQKHQVDDVVLRKVIRQTWKITTERDLQLHGRLIEGGQTLALVDLFKYMLRTADPIISVITTNYDRLGEYAGDLANATVRTGFSGSLIQGFDPSPLKEPRLDRRSRRRGEIHILKVHGSLDWFLGPDLIPIAIPLSQRIPKTLKPQIVTPGVSKYRQVLSDPFRTIVNCADERLMKAPAYLCIGYGFNDEHIQPKLIDGVRRGGLPIMILAKRLTNAAKSAFLSGKAAKFLMIEECENGTRVYSPDTPKTGAVMRGKEFWELSNFMKLLEN